MGKPLKSRLANSNKFQTLSSSDGMFSRNSDGQISGNAYMVKSACNEGRITREDSSEARI